MRGKVALIFCCLFGVLGGCSSRVYMIIRNDGYSDLAVLSNHYDYELINVAPGGEGEAIIYFDCFRVRYEGVVYELEPALSSRSYIRSGVFSSYIYAAFTEGKGVSVYPDEGRKSGGIVFRNKDCSRLIERH
ncbi:hypothetical protein D3C85_1123240 [compost metagenome]